MMVVYDSLTGQGKKFAQALGYPVLSVNEVKDLKEKVFLITRNFGYGQISKATEAFLDKHRDRVVGVAVGGNKNWGTNFGAAGDKIQERYGIPLVLKYEGSGYPEERAEVKQYLEELNANT